MLIKPKLPLIILIITAVALATWSYPIVKQRYFSNSEKTEEVAPEISTDSEIEEDIPLDGGQTDVTEEEILEEDAAIDEEIANGNIMEDNSFLEIFPSDCTNGCKEFDEPEDIQYCKQYCGLTVPAKTTEGCDKFADLEKDYCFKNEAVQKRDIKLCDQIEDDGIKKACRNRIAEDILDTPAAQQ